MGDDVEGRDDDSGEIGNREEGTGKSMLRYKVMIGLAAFAAGAAYAAPFKDGDTVVWLGDSITCGGRYHEFVRDYYATRFPEAKITFYNSGKNGDNAAGAQARLADDVAQLKPNRVLIHFGMNDVGRGDYSAKRTPQQIAHGEKCRKDFEANIVRLADGVLAAAPGAKIAFATPTPYDDTAVITSDPKANAKNWVGCNAALKGLGDYVKGLAEKRGVPCVDWHAPLNGIIERHRKAGDTAFMFTGTDRVHPQTAGHVIMAWTFLKQQGVPAIVSDVAIDAKSGKVAKSENAAVTDLKASADGVSCTMLEKALPLPLPPEAAEYLAEFKVEETLNREVFAVTGLKAGNYALLIDGKEVATGDAAAFAKGIWLGFNEKTPQYAQAQKFFAANKAAADAERKLRIYFWNDKIATPEARQKCFAQYDKAREHLKIVPHTYEVKRRDEGRGMKP